MFDFPVIFYHSFRPPVSINPISLIGRKPHRMALACAPDSTRVDHPC